jgi:hypothetical protein
LNIQLISACFFPHPALPLRGGGDPLCNRQKVGFGFPIILKKDAIIAGIAGVNYT